MPLVFSFLLGVKHATELDHLAAMGVVMRSNNHNRVHALVTGLSWGLGHASMILIFFWMSWYAFLPKDVLLQLPLEKILGVVLLVSGLFWFRQWSKREELSLPERQVQPNFNQQNNFNSRMAGCWKAFGFGLIHGLAGSATISALLWSTSHSLEDGFFRVSLFALGGALAMGVFCLLYQLQARWMALRHRQLARSVNLLIILVTCIIGIRLILVG